MTAKNKACDAKFVPFVKMVKGVNREAGDPIEPAFLLEVMALDLVIEPFGRYRDEIQILPCFGRGPNSRRLAGSGRARSRRQCWRGDRTPEGTF